MQQQELTALVAERDGQVERLREELEERDTQVEVLRAALGEQDSQLEGLRAELAARVEASKEADANHVHEVEVGCLFQNLLFVFGFC